MQRINILAVGRLKDDFFEAAVAEYAKRLKAYCKLNIVEIPVGKLPDRPSEGDVKRALLYEEDKILKALPGGYTIALCIEGRRFSSEGFAGVINRPETLNFIIGGSYGLSESLKRRADQRISFSEMTFPHRLFRVMLLEQIYRGYKINNGGSYHK